MCSITYQKYKLKPQGDTNKIHIRLAENWESLITPNTVEYVSLTPGHLMSWG